MICVQLFNFYDLLSDWFTNRPFLLYMDDVSHKNYLCEEEVIKPVNWRENYRLREAHLYVLTFPTHCGKSLLLQNSIEKNIIAPSVTHHMAAVSADHVQRHKWAHCRHSWNAAAWRTLVARRRAAQGQPCGVGAGPARRGRGCGALLRNLLPPSLLAASASTSPAHARRAYAL